MGINADIMAIRHGIWSGASTCFNSNQVHYVERFASMISWTTTSCHLRVAFWPEYLNNQGDPHETLHLLSTSMRPLQYSNLTLSRPVIIQMQDTQALNSPHPTLQAFSSHTRLHNRTRLTHHPRATHTPDLTLVEARITTFNIHPTHGDIFRSRYQRPLAVLTQPCFRRG